MEAEGDFALRFASTILPRAVGPLRPSQRAKAFGGIAALALLLCTSLLVALETPHRYGNDVRYLYAEPNHCVCIFIGTEANYRDYRDILSRPVAQPDDVSPDYKTQASALLYGDPYDWNNLNQPDSIADYLRTYY